MDYHALEKMTVVALRDEAKKHGMKATPGMKKEELVSFLTETLGIEVPRTTDKKKKTHVEMSKASVKKKIVEVKEAKAAARSKNDAKVVALNRRRLHRLKRRMRSAA